MHDKPDRIAVTWIVFALLSVGGCTSPSATSDLIAVGRKGLDLAEQAEQHAHRRLMEGYRRQKRSLDSAFDADVRLIAEGQIRDSQGQAVPLTAEWVISARKGYAAAVETLYRQMDAEQTAHATQQDNLAAAKEALDLAAVLVVLQWNVGESFKQKFLQLKRSVTNAP